MFQERNINVAIAEVVVSELNDVYRQRKTNNFCQLLNGFLNVIDNPGAKDVQYEVAEGWSAFVEDVFPLLPIQKVRLRLLCKLHCLFNN